MSDEILKPVHDKKLVGKTVIITGASRGMGRAAALLFGQHGAEVVVNYQKDKEAANQVVEKIKAFGSKAIAVQADVGKIADLPNLVNACLDTFGKIDNLYHNAAIHWVCPEIQDVTEEIWDATYNSIIKGPFFLTQLVIPHMLKQGGGNIIFTSTSSAGTATPTDPHYMTAKNAVNALYRVLAGYLSPEIRVNCIVPGFVMTDMFRHHSPEMWGNMAASVPMNRMATPMDVAKAALFLASDDSSYLTGESISVDGGRSSAIPRRIILPAVKLMKQGLGTYDKKDYGENAIKTMDVGL